MNIRVTGQTQTNNAIANLRRQQADVAKFQDLISTGVKVKAASDAPAAFATIATARGASKRAGTYQETLNDSTSDLNAGVSALQDTSAVLARAGQLAIDGASGTIDATGFEALATEVDSLLTRTLASANRQQDDRYLFGGTATDAPPFRVDTLTADGKPATIAYDGAGERARALVSRSQTVDTRYVGRDVFQAAGEDVFGALIGLRDDLRNTTLNDSQKTEALSARLADLQTARTRVGEVMAEQSGNLAGMEAVQSRLQDLKLNADVRAGDLEATDYAEAVVNMKQQESAFESTLGVAARMLQTSLLDFLR
jgi:flagellar hook-associated protein 3 FlgL